MTGRQRESAPLRPVPPATEVADGQYDALANDLVYIIQQSRFVQEAFLDAYLDGVVLAVEQVQDVRLWSAENPEEPGWGQVLFTFMLTAALESTLAGAALAAVSKVFFSRVLRQNRVFILLPKSASGRDLQRRVRQLAREEEGELARGVRARVPVGSRGTAQDPVTEALRKGIGSGGLDDLGKEGVELYHASLEAVLRGTDATATNLAALAKGAREMAANPTPSSPKQVDDTSSAGVSLLSRAQHYASTNRMAMRVRHARFEALARSGSLSRDDLVRCAELFDVEPLTTQGQQRVAVDLADVRRRYGLLFEAVIWAGLYGFSKQRNHPKLGTRSIEDVPQRISDYWIARFGDLVDEWVKGLSRVHGYTGDFAKQTKMTQLAFLRDWMLEVAEKAPPPLRRPTRR